MTDRYDISPEMGVLAAEYVLGTMSAETRAAFKARLVNEPALVEEVRAWEAYFATMAELEVEEVTPPARIQRALEAQLFGEPAGAVEAATQSIWEKVSFWRGVSLASSAVAVVALGVAVLPYIQPPDPGAMPEGLDATGIPDGTILMTHLIPTENSTLGLAVTREPSGQLQVRRVAGDMSDGRAQELWLIVGDGAPVSLGLLGEDPLTTIDPDPQVARLFEAGAVLAISDEPAGGSPTGAPTGEVLALGTLVAL
ncbi:anti-sigma factor [Gymnodinialimonas hymeniacidonis]|uniref:anti-sigma factor n=1 Tax=Gymnodinialimonas hymeniacidonis TaxID=3126508 RepID=UPI0034C5E332